MDLRFTGRPLRALVEPPAAVKLVPVRRKFALDDRETVVVMPIAATAAVRDRDTLPSSTRSDGRAELGTGAGMGAVGRFSSTPLPWDAFLSGVGDRVDANGAIRGADGLNGVRSDVGVRCRNPVGDRLRILSLTTGEMLTEIPTPWMGVSLARGGAAVGLGVGGTMAEEGHCYSRGDVKFWGVASGVGQSAVVFEASL